MDRCLVKYNGSVEFVDHLHTWNGRGGEGIEFLGVVAVYHHPGRQRPQVGMLAGYDKRAEMLVQGRRRNRARGATSAASIGAHVLESRLLLGGRHLPEHAASTS